LVIRFTKASEGHKKKVFEATGTLIKHIGGEGSKRFVLITAAHNFILYEMIPDGELE